MEKLLNVKISPFYSIKKQLVDDRRGFWSVHVYKLVYLSRRFTLPTPEGAKLLTSAISARLSNQNISHLIAMKKQASKLKAAIIESDLRAIWEIIWILLVEDDVEKIFGGEKIRNNLVSC